MKNIRIFISVIIIMLLTSCIVDPSEAITKLNINNNSNYLVESVIYINGNEYSHFSIEPSQFYEIENNCGKKRIKLQIKKNDIQKK